MMPLLNSETTTTDLANGCSINSAEPAPKHTSRANLYDQYCLRTEQYILWYFAL